MAGPPPAPAPHVGLNTASIDFGARQVANPTAPRRVTVTNHGTADLVIGTVGIAGTDVADFAAENDTCSNHTIAPAASCAVDVRFTPAHTGDLAAQLRIDDNAANAPHSVALTGVGLGAAAGTPTPAGGSGGGTSAPAASTPSASAGSAPITIVQAVPGVTVASFVQRSLGVSSLTLSRRISATRLRAQGLRVAMRLPDGAQVVRFAVHRTRNGTAVGRALAIGYRVPSRPGVYRLVLRDRALLRKLKRGSYVLQIRAGASRTALGPTSSIGFTVTR